MFKLELSIILSVALFIPLPTLASSEWNIAPNLTADSSFTDAPPSLLNVNWSHSSLEDNFPASSSSDYQLELTRKRLGLDFFLTKMDSHWLDNTVLWNQAKTGTDNFDSLKTDSGTWLIQAYLETTHKNEWNGAFVTLHLNSASESVANDSRATSLHLPNSLSGALLLIALLGWNMARRRENHQEMANASSNQRLL
ncbi:MAG: hypothetical protein ACU83N_13905 [Gammaproteobacteria bacterium]